MSYFPPIFTVSNVGRLDKMEPAEWDGDPRGCIWIWETPNRSSTYCIGVDPSVGRTGWSRYTRMKEDFGTDNGAIEVVRVGKNGEPDRQVAEYAAPVDAFDLAYVVNLLGRLYAGTEEDQAKVIIEVFPGPGAGTLQTCFSLGYFNHFKWEYYGDTVATPTKAMGWHASSRTNRDLWIKASRHIVLERVIIKSPWLVEEFSDCRWNPVKEYADNPGGKDDRVRAFNLALWVANSWSMDMERTTEKVGIVEPVEWQASDMGLDEIYEGWANMMDRLG
jgi:hypothetical protein